jgi:hypothetical protein
VPGGFHGVVELGALEAAVPPQPVRTLQAALLVVVAERRIPELALLEHDQRGQPLVWAV